jgi:hypothetical protein
MNIKKAAYNVVQIDKKHREVLERYQCKKNEAIELDDL